MRQTSPDPVTDAHRSEGAAEPAQMFQRGLAQIQSSMRDGPIRNVIMNKTIHPILIERVHPGGQAEPLLIPPLGARRLNSADLDAYDWRRWQHYNLVAVEEQPQPAAITFWGVVWFVIFLLATAGLLRLLADLVAPTRFFGWDALLFSGAAIIAFALAQRRPYVTEIVKQLFGLVLIALVGAGLPALIIVFVSLDLIRGIIATRDMADSSSTIALVLLIVVITFVASLPAMLYFLFQRLLYQTKYLDFVRDSLRLYREAYTIDDITELYGKSINSRTGMRQEAISPIITYVPVYLLTFLLSFGWSLILIPSVNMATLMDTTLQQIITPQLTPITFGFLGSYVFSLDFLFRRYTRSDLGPKAYSYLAIRLPSVFVLVGLMQVTLLPPAEINNGLWTATLNIVAFLIGTVPHRAIVSLSSRFAQMPLVNSLVAPLRNKTPLSRLEGITLYDETRLLEEGIDNIESLAHHNLIELVYNTRIPTTRLVDLVDQAILYLHLRSLPDADSSTPSPLDWLRAYGIRTATELEKTYALMKARAEGQEPIAFLRLLDAHYGERAAIDVPRLRLVLDTLGDDMWMPQIRNWYASFHEAQRIHTFADFYPPDDPPPSVARHNDKAAAPNNALVAKDPTPAQIALADPLLDQLLSTREVEG